MEIPPRNVIFVGDLHGELESILSVQKLISKYKTHAFVFLGDYADRGPAQIETINLVMALALNEPERILMLRGNHESDKVAQKYGFYTEVTRTFSFDVYSKYLEVFQVLPMAVYNSEGVFACHGGIPEGVSSIEEIQICNRMNYDFPNDILFQLAWNDPKEADFNSQYARLKISMASFEQGLSEDDCKLDEHKKSVIELNINFLNREIESLCSLRRLCNA